MTNISGKLTVINKYTVTLFALLTGLATWIFYPALFLDQSLVHGDNLHHGYAILKFHSKVIHEGYSPFWTDLIYGGHPIFAESQGGLSNPFNYLVAWLLPPEFGHNLIHYLSMIALGIGTYGLSRTFRISPESAIFAAIAATFSGLIIHTNSNMTAISAAACIPWALWMFERWLNAPTSTNAICFGLSIAMQIFAGYPHFFHGTVLYMLLSLCTLPFNKDAYPLIKSYLSTGFLAVLICAGVSAIQWLPLVELASLSHRKEGTEIYNLPVDFAVRGFISTVKSLSPIPYFPIVGSVFVCALASMVIFFPVSLRIKGNLIACFFLLNLGFADASPIYQIVVANNLIPGLTNFRMMWPYFYITTISICVFSGLAVDWISSTKILGWNLLIRKLFVLSAFAIWIYICENFDLAEISIWNYLIPLIAISIVVFTEVFNVKKLTPKLFIILLLFETILLKVSTFEFAPNAELLLTPKSVSLIRNDSGEKGLKHFHTTSSPLSMVSAYLEDMTPRVRSELNHLIASSNLIWDIPSYRGSFALKLSRKGLIQDTVLEEITGASSQAPGLRLMDILSIGYISTNNYYPNKSFVNLKKNTKSNLLLKNTAAKPRIQIYDTLEVVSSPEDALASLKKSDKKILVIEASYYNQNTIYDAADSTYKIIEKSATSYTLTTESSAPFWIFISDANYPGWKAQIDGVAVQVYTAQVLGKAIEIPAGKHEMRVYFDSHTIKVGAAITVLSLLFLLAVVLFQRRIVVANKE
jgi:hypothetical protein